VESLANHPIPGGFFRAQLTFPPEYPHLPPKLRFIPPPQIFHPNVYPNGEVCISILHPPEEDKYGYESAAERWSPVQTPESILLSVISMLSSPNDESPANVDAAKLWREDEKEFKRRCRRIVRESLGDDWWVMERTEGRDIYDRMGIYGYLALTAIEMVMGHEVLVVMSVFSSSLQALNVMQWSARNSTVSAILCRSSRTKTLDDSSRVSYHKGYTMSSILEQRSIKHSIVSPSTARSSANADSPTQGFK
jgi:ubiquitin-protein ligase